MESRKLPKEPNDYFSDEEIAEAKERFPKSDRIHKLIARLEAAEFYIKKIHMFGMDSMASYKAQEAWCKACGVK